MTNESQQVIGAEAIREIVKLAERALSAEQKAKEKPEAMTAKGEGYPADKFWFRQPNGTWEIRTADPGWHREALATPITLREFVKVHAGEGSAVFVSDAQVVFVYDLAERRNFAACPLTLTPQARWMLAQGVEPMNQVEFIRLLRIDLRGCLDRGLLESVRSYKFATGTDGGGDIQHGRESIGKSLRAEVIGNIAEEVGMSIPIFANHFGTQGITAAVEIFPTNQRFRLTPYPGEARKALDAALDDVAATLSGDKMPPVYFGNP